MGVGDLDALNHLRGRQTIHARVHRHRHTHVHTHTHVDKRTFSKVADVKVLR